MRLFQNSRPMLLGVFTFGLTALSMSAARAGFQDLLVGDQGNGAVSHLSGSGTELPPFIDNAGVTGPANGGTPTVSNPHGVAVAPNGDVFVADFGSSPQAIKEFSPSGTPVSTVSLAPFSNSVNGFQPNALVFSPTNALLYVDSGTGATPSSIVYTLNTATHSLTPVTLTGLPGGVSTDLGATGMAFDSAGNLYVAALKNNAVYEFTPTGSYLQTFASAGNTGKPNGVAVNNAANVLYVASSTSNTIAEFNTTTGAYLGSISNPAFAGAALGSLSYDPASGRLYVGGNLNEKVYALIASTGVLDPTYGNGGSVTLTPGPGIFQFPEPNYLSTFAATVPEPSSVALMGLGLLGMVGLAGRKGRIASA